MGAIITTPTQISVSSVAVAPLFRFMDTVGDGTGTKNANGNYSGAEEEFFIAPPSGTIYQIERLIVTIEDTSGMSATEYGNLGTALATGIEVQVRTGASTVVQDLTDGVAVTTNAGWGSHCFDVALSTYGTGDEVVKVRWTFAASGGDLRLDGTAGQRLAVVLNDDLTGLVAHYFMAQGFVVSS